MQITESKPSILLIETSGPICSVALSSGGEIVDIIESHEDRTHAQNLSVFIDDLLHRNDIPYNLLDAVAVSKGPGSYTGLRIGTATAKGLCYGTNKPLIAINSLQSLVQICLQGQEFDEGTLLCPMFDARRMEVYTALFDSKGNFVNETRALIIDKDSFSDELNEHKIVFFGDGSAKCRDILVHPHASFAEVALSASGMTRLAYDAYFNGNFEDVAYFEPFYLKDFLITQPKKKVL